MDTLSPEVPTTRYTSASPRGALHRARRWLHKPGDQRRCATDRRGEVTHQIGPTQCTDRHRCDGAPPPDIEHGCCYAAQRSAFAPPDVRRIPTAPPGFMELFVQRGHPAPADSPLPLTALGGGCESCSVKAQIAFPKAVVRAGRRLPTVVPIRAVLWPKSFPSRGPQPRQGQPDAPSHASTRRGPACAVAPCRAARWVDTQPRCCRRRTGGSSARTAADAPDVALLHQRDQESMSR